MSTITLFDVDGVRLDTVDGTPAYIIDCGGACIMLTREQMRTFLECCVERNVGGIIDTVRRRPRRAG